MLTWWRCMGRWWTIAFWNNRGRVDVIAIQVPSNRSRCALLPQIDCLPGTIFCLDGWKAYHQLGQNLDLDDVLHYPVNHLENFVYPTTGAHTQTVERFWHQCKAQLSNFSLKFLWFRYCKERKLDMFVHMLKCICEKRPDVRHVLPPAEMTKIKRGKQMMLSKCLYMQWKILKMKSDILVLFNHKQSNCPSHICPCFNKCNVVK